MIKPLTLALIVVTYYDSIHVRTCIYVWSSDENYIDMCIFISHCLSVDSKSPYYMLT